MEQRCRTPAESPGVPPWRGRSMSAITKLSSGRTMARRVLNGEDDELRIPGPKVADRDKDPLRCCPRGQCRGRSVRRG